MNTPIAAPDAATWRNPALLTGLFLSWLGAIAAGLVWLPAYEAAPGRAAAAPVDWPAASAVRPCAGRFTLVLFVHPHCPCTRASLDNLAWALARGQGQVDAHAIFVLPAGAPDRWDETAIRASAAAIPGVRIVVDARGREAGRFGAATSGETLLYDPHGRLVFRGGITAGRGHAGDSPGRRALVACFAGAAPGCRALPVFGCPLLDANESR